MRKTTALFFLPLFFAAQVVADQTFTDRTTWESSLTSAAADRVSSDYDAAGIAFGQNLGAGAVIQQPWGSQTFVVTDAAAANSVTVLEITGSAPILTTSATLCVSLNVDAGAPFEGAGFDYTASEGGEIILRDSAGAPIGNPIALAAATDGFFGFICEGVAAVEVCFDGELNGITNELFSFNPVVGEISCQDQLQAIIDGLNAIYASASAADQYWLDWAIYDLTCAQDPIFWSSENLLSDFGTDFFGNVFWATYDLECVSDDELVADSLVAIQDLLSCVVEAEIDFAMQNPNANNFLLDYAIYFEDFADQFAEAELFLQAVLLHFYAWLFAHCA